MLLVTLLQNWDSQMIREEVEEKRKMEFCALQYDRDAPKFEVSVEENKRNLFKQALHRFFCVFSSIEVYTRFFSFVALGVFM